jgi:hypothetical protein
MSSRCWLGSPRRPGGPSGVVLAATVGLETFVAYFIPDNLTLNIIMLIYPLESIRQWQMH